jgi:hypothetical protein
LTSLQSDLKTALAAELSSASLAHTEIQSKRVDGKALGRNNVILTVTVVYATDLAQQG